MTEADCATWKSVSRQASDWKVNDRLTHRGAKGKRDGKNARQHVETRKERNERIKDGEGKSDARP